jgi:hypothetical protein
MQDESTGLFPMRVLTVGLVLFFSCLSAAGQGDKQVLPCGGDLPKDQIEKADQWWIEGTEAVCSPDRYTIIVFCG